MLDFQKYDFTFSACHTNKEYDELTLDLKKLNFHLLINFCISHPYKIRDYKGNLQPICTDVAYDMFRMLKDKGITKISFDNLIDKFMVSDFNIYGAFNEEDINFIRNNIKRLVRITPVEITDWEVTTVLSKMENYILHNHGFTIDEVQELNKFYYDPKSTLTRIRNFNSLIVAIHGLFNQYKDEFDKLYYFDHTYEWNEIQIDQYKDLIMLFMDFAKIYREKVDWYNKCYYQRLVDLGEREPRKYRKDDII